MPDHLDVRTSLALGRDAVIATNLDDLMGAQGVPLSLEKGEQQAVVIMPVPCCSHTASNAVPPERPAEGIEPHFDTAEHAIIVWGLKLQTEAGLLDAAKASLPVATNSNFVLTYGQFIALGGDFYGDPDQPVCTQCHLAYFRQAAVLIFPLARMGLASFMVAGASWRVPCWPGFLTG